MLLPSVMSTPCHSHHLSSIYSTATQQTQQHSRHPLLGSFDAHIFKPIQPNTVFFPPRLRYPAYNHTYLFSYYYPSFVSSVSSLRSPSVCSRLLHASFARPSIPSHSHSSVRPVSVFTPIHSLSTTAPSRFMLNIVYYTNPTTISSRLNVVFS